MLIKKMKTRIYAAPAIKGLISYTIFPTQIQLHLDNNNSDTNKNWIRYCLFALHTNTLRIVLAHKTFKGTYFEVTRL